MRISAIAAKTTRLPKNDGLSKKRGLDFPESQSREHEAYQGLAAIKPAAIRIPLFSTLTFCAALNCFLSAILSTIPRTTPPTNMAKVVSSGRYMPTQTSIGLFTCTRMKAMPSAGRR